MPAVNPASAPDLRDRQVQEDAGMPGRPHAAPAHRRPRFPPRSPGISRRNENPPPARSRAPEQTSIVATGHGRGQCDRRVTPAGPGPRQGGMAEGAVRG